MLCALRGRFSEYRTLKIKKSCFYNKQTIRIIFTFILLPCEKMASTISDLEDLWQIAGWAFFTLLLWGCSLWFFKRGEYRFLRTQTLLLPEWLFRVLFILLLLTLSFAAWRVWDIDDWDSDPLPLFIYFLWIVSIGCALALWLQIINPIAGVVGYVIAVVLGLTVTVLFFVEDVLAGALALLGSLVMLYLLLVNIYLWWMDAMVQNDRGRQDVKPASQKLFASPAAIPSVTSESETVSQQANTELNGTQIGFPVSPYNKTSLPNQYYHTTHNQNSQSSQQLQDSQNTQNTQNTQPPITNLDHVKISYVPSNSN